MDFPILSVVVPVYNAEQYIERCLNSILAQHYESTEIVLIDDGSTDSSAEKCKRYASDYPFIKYYFQVNKGPSSARNEGVARSNGQYLMFLDADDTLHPLCIKLFYKLLSRDNTDLVCGRLAIGNNDSFKSEKSSSIRELLKSATILSSEELYKKAFLDDSLFSQCCKLAKKSLWAKLPFKEGSLYEDADVVYRLFDAANSITFVDSALYYYYQNEGSTTNRVGDFSQQCADLLHVSSDCYSFVCNKYPNVIKAALGYRINALAGYCVRAAATKRESNSISYSNELDYIRKNIRFVIFGKYITTKNKAKILMVSLSPKLTSLVYLAKARCL